MFLLCRLLDAGFTEKLLFWCKHLILKEPDIEKLPLSFNFCQREPAIAEKNAIAHERTTTKPGMIPFFQSTWLLLVVFK
jgi:hypothetical protein